jgi:hypothetical protein
MSNFCRFVFSASLGLMLCGIAIAQRSVAAAPRPSDDEPSLAATLQFISDKINHEGRMDFIVTSQNTITGKSEEPSKSSMEVKVIAVDPNGELTVKGVSQGIDPDSKCAITFVLRFKDVQKLRVETDEDNMNSVAAKRGQPEIKFHVDPQVYVVAIDLNSGLVTGHRQFLKNDKSVGDDEVQFNDPSLKFRDEDTANRVAKAMIHAVELCGGGSKDPF